MAEKTIESPHKPRLGRTERRLLVAFAIVLLLLLGYAGYRWALARAVDAELDRIRAAGYPATTAELEEWIGEPDDNLAPDVLALARRIVQPAGAEEDLVPILGAAEAPPPGQPWPLEMRQAAAEVLKRNRTVIDRLQALDWSREARYIGDVTRDFDAALPDYTALRRAVSLLCLDAQFAAAQGRPDEAAASVRIAIKLARSIRDDPFLIGHLVYVACEGVSLGTLEHCLSLTRFDEADLAVMADLTSVSDVATGPRRALIGERMLISAEFEKLNPVQRLINNNFNGGAVAELAAFAAGVDVLDHLAYLRYIEGMIDMTRRPVWEWPDRAEAIRTELQEIGPWRLGLPRYEEGQTFSLAFEMFLRSYARRRAALGALAVERYRLAHGALPEALGDCVPAFLDAVPLDPHTGDPIRYQVEPDRFTVYTVGEDKTDDGGVDEDNPPAGSEHYGPGTDITFTVRLERSTGGESATSP